MAGNTPKDWKNYDDFAAGIATNRLPQTSALNGTSHGIRLDDNRLIMIEIGDGSIDWNDGRRTVKARLDVVEVAPDTYFLDIDFADGLEAETLVLNTATRRALSVRSIVRSKEEAAGEPQVKQIYMPGRLDGGTLSGSQPAPSRDLIGLRAHYTYSPNHVYEHTYLSSERYAWQNLVGVQRGHGDVDMATTYKFAENQYVFGFREFKIPVASTFFYNFDDLRSTGKFLGVTGQGAVENNKAGAFIRKVSMTYYLPGEEPV